MSTETYAYPFDPTGTLASNKISSERQIISAPQHSMFYFIIPLAGPFFRTGHRVIHHPSGKVLVEGADYALTHRFHDASLACGKPIFGSITFYDHTLTGLVELEYQTIGGPWTLSQAKITELLSNSLSNPRITTWEQVAELPHEFPVVDHPWDLVDLVGASAVVEKLNAIEDAIRDSAAGSTDAHVNDFNNPHQVTKAQVGLSNLLNYPISDANEATGGTANDRYMTPLRTREAILSMVANDFVAHKNATNNPHMVSKAQVGLSNVANYGVATNAQGIEGIATDLYMTPISTAAALQNVTDTLITPHVNNLNNPHQVTKAQVGLSLVENLPLSTTEQAIAATSNAFYMTPLRTREMLDALLGETMINHINNRTNPHGVTKSQIGLGNVPNLGLATTAAAQAGSDDSGVMTPRLVYEAILALGGGSAGGGGGDGIDSLHRADYNNPHQVSAEQVGAYDKSTVDAALANKLSTTGTANNSDRLEGLTADEVIRRASARFDWAAVQPVDLDDGAGGTITINDGVTWTALGSFVPPGVIDDANPVADMVFYCTGGDRRQASAIPMYLVKLNIYPQVKMEVEQLAGSVNETQFGYVRDMSTQAITVYVRSAPLRNALSVLVVSDPTGGLGMVQEPLDNEPFDITYAEDFVYMGGSPNVDAFPGDVLYGKNPHHESLSDFGSMLEFVNFATGDEEVLAARQTFSHMGTDHHEFISASAWADISRHAVKADLVGWRWNATTSNIEHLAETSSLSLLLSPWAYTSYSFEVEVSSTAATDGTVGVCAAFIRKNGKDYGIYALRTPGGLTAASDLGELPGGDIYENFSVGYNLLQDDAIDLGSTSTDLPGAVDWPTAGVSRIRVTRQEGVIFVQCSQFGSTDITTGPTLVIDLNDLPELAVFKAPTLWGLAKYKQANASYKIINRPDLNPPYISYSADADGNDTSTLYRNNGIQWVGQPMSLENSFIKPHRLYMSEINNRMYWTQRDGTVRLLAIGAYVTEPVTVLTE